MPLMIKFTLLENEALQIQSRSSPVDQNEGSLLDQIRNVENRLVDFQKELGEVDREAKPLMGFAAIRLHW